MDCANRTDARGAADRCYSAVDDAGDVWEDMEGGGGETGV